MFISIFFLQNHIKPNKTYHKTILFAYLPSNFLVLFAARPSCCWPRSCGAKQPVQKGRSTWWTTASWRPGTGSTALDSSNWDYKLLQVAHTYTTKMRLHASYSCYKGSCGKWYTDMITHISDMAISMKHVWSHCTVLTRFIVITGSKKTRLSDIYHLVI